jgi:membrane protease YdiL (CAAX protease family)
VHLPDAWLALAACLTGTVWSYSYLRDRQLLPIAVSHAVLGVSFYYGVVGCDLYETVVSRFSNF